MFRDRIKSLQRVRASELLPNPRNWRTHPVAQRRAMRAVLDEVGFADALLARETVDGKLELVDGHLRADIAPNEVVPVLVLDLNDSEADLVLATHDPLGAMAGADARILKDLLDNLELQNDTLTAQLHEMHADAFAERDSGVLSEASREHDDRAIQEKWQVEPGQLWQIGPHRLLCGDATNEQNYRTLFEGAQPVAMITDPPYGVAYDPLWRERKGKRVGRQRGQVANDDVCDWSAAFRLFTGAVAYVWHASRYTASVERQLEQCGFLTRAQIIWAKQHFILSRGDYHWQHEPCWYAVRSGFRANWQGDRCQSTLWEIDNLSAFGGSDLTQATSHGTQKPAECMARPMRNNTASGEVVYDPFLGSGTTMVAAEHLNRTCYAMEIQPEFCALTLERMTNFGTQPQLLTGTLAG